MTNVFLGGSRNISKLNKAVKERIKNIINKQFTILIGDADGADKAFQLFLKVNNYNNVLVYCSGNSCRNNLADWETVNIGEDSKIKNISFYMIKDGEMANNADYGFMLWDGKSAGTLNNVINLLSKQKTTLLYFSPHKKFYSISNVEIIFDILDHCDFEDLKKIDKKINYKNRLNSLKTIQYKLVD